MSSGRIHSRSSLILAAGFSVGALVSQEPRLLECALGSLVGILVSPDLDLSNGGIVGGKEIQKRVGWAGKRVWEKFWQGYSASFKHGTWGSHSVPFGTFIRLAYVYYWIIFIPHVIVKLLGLFHWELIPVLEWWAIIFLNPMFLIGLMSSDLIHIALDFATKEKK